MKKICVFHGVYVPYKHTTWNPCGVFVGYYIRGNIIVKRQFTLPKEETDQLWIDQLFILVREFLGGNDKLIRNNH